MAQSAADRLTHFGAEAVPYIQAAFEQPGNSASVFPENADLLLDAYARIRGGDAFPWLKQLKDQTGGPELDEAIAISLRLTSYLSVSQPVSEGTFRCGGDPRPEDTLDRVIVAWERDDRRAVLKNLGPHAIKALDGNGAWPRIWPVERDSSAAVGYRIRTSKPDRMLHLNAEFANRSGGNCGTRSVTFLQTGDLRGYAIDNSDLPELLATISACAVDLSAGLASQ